MRTPGVALQMSPGDTLLGRWTVAGQSRPLATGVLIAVREYHTGRAGRARVHWPSLAGRTVRRRLRAVADFLGRDQGVEIVAVVGEALGDPDGAEATAHTREVLP